MCVHKRRLCYCMCVGVQMLKRRCWVNSVQINNEDDLKLTQSVCVCVHVIIPVPSRLEVRQSWPEQLSKSSPF